MLGLRTSGSVRNARSAPRQVAPATLLYVMRHEGQVRGRPRRETDARQEKWLGGERGHTVGGRLLLMRSMRSG